MGYYLHGTAAPVEGLTGLDNFSEEGDILMLLLANHDRVAEVEVDQHDVFLFARLEEEVFDVREQHVYRVRLRGPEPKPVLVQLESPWGRRGRQGSEGGRNDEDNSFL